MGVCIIVEHNCLKIDHFDWQKKKFEEKISKYFLSKYFLFNQNITIMIIKIAKVRRVLKVKTKNVSL